MKIRPSVRLRLTLTYSGLFVLAGASLLSLNYLLVSHREHGKNTAISIVCKGTTPGLGLFQSEAPAGATPAAGASGTAGAGATTGAANGSATGPTGVVLPPGCSKVAAKGAPAPAGGSASTLPVSTLPIYRTAPAPADLAKVGALKQLATKAQDHTLHTLQIESGIALGLMALASLGLGWLVAGRVLRPVHRITDTARRLSQETLHERIGLEGPNDELKELADTFDAMLARLDRAFTSQRRFVANASHELRTPLATERVLIDEALANRQASTAELRSILEELRANSEDSERLIDSLLVLARSERGVERWLPVDLAALAGQAVERARAEAVTRGVELRTDLRPATTSGDPALLERLIGNLVENGIRHNLPTGGWLEVRTGMTGMTGMKEGHALLDVSNSGRVLDPDVVPRLLEPFRREGADRTASGTGAGGFGLGLSIVQAVVAAHDGQLETTAPPDGGLQVIARLTAAPATSARHPDSPPDPAATTTGPDQRTATW
jgi:signal transduction histidine kinase